MNFIKFQKSAESAKCLTRCDEIFREFYDLAGSTGETQHGWIRRLVNIRITGTCTPWYYVFSTQVGLGNHDLWRE